MPIKISHNFNKLIVKTTDTLLPKEQVWETKSKYTDRTSLSPKYIETILSTFPQPNLTGQLKQTMK
jgi:hypothetical protein